MPPSDLSASRLRKKHVRMLLNLFHEVPVIPNDDHSEPIILQLGADLKVCVLLLSRIVMRPIQENAYAGTVLSLIVEVRLGIHFGCRAALGIVRQSYLVIAEEAEKVPLQR